MKRIWNKSLITIICAVLILYSSIFVSAANTEFIIVYQNDFHGHLASFTFGENEVGGLSHIAGLVQAVRAFYNHPVVWLDGGDTWHGTTLANLFNGQPVVEAFNAAGLDAMVLGNHEFNYGLDTLIALEDQAHFSIVSANVTTTDGSSIVSPYTLLQVGEMTVGILGLTTLTTPWSTHPNNVEGLIFSDPVDVASSLLPVIVEEADFVVALTHLGHEEEIRLAREVPGIDVIVGGHSHSLISTPVVIGDTILVQANEYGKYLGVLRLIVNDGKIVDHDGQLIPITGDLPVHPGVATIIENWSELLDDQLTRTIGETSIQLDGEREDIRSRQTNLGYIVAEAMRSFLGADIGLANGGAIRASIPPGAITLGDLYNVVPFDNLLVGVELTGEQMRDALEHSVRALPLQFGGFLQAAGLTYTFDANLPAGNRVTSIMVGDEPLQDDRLYTVATTDFLVAGGDGYNMLVDANKFFGSELTDGYLMRDVLIEYWMTHPVVGEPALP